MLQPLFESRVVTAAYEILIAGDGRKELWLI